MLKCVLGFCLPSTYQKLESPTPDGAVHVDINVEILDILSVNDKEFSITMSMYFSVQWREGRIVTNNTIEPGSWYPISLEFLNEIWIPNVFIYNLKTFQNVAVLKKLAGVWIIGGKGGTDVFYNQFTTVTFMCPMRYEKFPLDSHICKFRVGSTNMDINYMRFGETTVGYDDSSRCEDVKWENKELNMNSF